ncbi:UNVERIFIED_CONTAM: hypothetical protein LK11_43845 [Mumia flava]
MHPRLSMAIKGAVAAALAWFVAHLLPAPLSDYAYYAPLGAVVATAYTVVASVRDSVRTVAAIAVGAAIAQLVEVAGLPSVVGVAVVVVLAILAAGWPWFADARAWVVTSALFVLILGRADAIGYAGSYTALVALGAAIGTAVNAVLPPLMLLPTSAELDRLRDTLVDQLDDLRDGLSADEAPSPDEWRAREREIRPVAARARQAVDWSRDAARANPRARRNARWVSSVTGRADALETSAEVVDDLTRMVVRWESRDRHDLAFGQALRPLVADALDAYASALRTTDDATADPGALDRLQEATDALHRAVRARRSEVGADTFVAGTVVLALGRAGAALGRHEPAP